MLDKFGVEIDVLLRGLLEEEARLMMTISAGITRDGGHQNEEAAQRSALARVQDVRLKINEIVLKKRQKKQPEVG